MAKTESPISFNSPLTWAAAAATLGVAIAGAAYAQLVNAKHDALKRTMLKTYDVPGTNYVTMMGIAELGPNEHVGAQRHPGPESGYVLEGEGTLVFEDGNTVVLKAGKSYMLPAGTAHAMTSGPDGVKVLVVWNIEKGKPLTSEVKTAH